MVDEIDVYNGERDAHTYWENCNPERMVVNKAEAIGGGFEIEAWKKHQQKIEA